MSSKIKSLLSPLASLKLTVALLALSIVLIYAGTIAQLDAGIWQISGQYFHSWFVRIPLKNFVPWPQDLRPRISGGVPMLGGYALGALLLFNLLAAHAVRFKLTARRAGIILIHAGLILLLVGEFVTSMFAVEGQMQIDEGSFANYVQDIRSIELAIVDPSAPDHNREWIIPASALRHEKLVQAAQAPVEPKLPFDVRVDDFYPNSQILGPRQAGAQSNARATAGLGVGLSVLEQPVYSGTETNAVDAPSAYISLSEGAQPLGTYLVSLWFDRPQDVVVDGKPYEVELRFKRDYKPYAIHLIDFAHDRYTGTNTPKNFSSRIRLVDPTRNEDREVVIRMNEPLRYAGETFYQASFKPGDKTTILQVVHNPGWLMPYFACAIGALGLVIHFGTVLLNFLRKRAAEARAAAHNAAATTGTAAAPNRSRFGLAEMLIPGAIAVFCLLYLVGQARVPQQPQSSAFDLRAFGTLPVSFEGRTQPIDSMARNTLKIIGERESLRLSDGSKLSAIEWLTDVIAQPEKSADYPVFRIDSPDVKGLLGFDLKDKYFSLNQILAHADAVEDQYNRANAVEERQRNDYQRKVIQLGEKLNRYSLFSREIGHVYFIPPVEGIAEWQPLASAVPATQQTVGAAAANFNANINPAAEHLLSALQAYHDADPQAFNAQVAAYHDLLRRELPAVMDKVSFEAFFNHFDPFMQCMALYVIVFVLACLSWLGFSRVFARSAMWVLGIALILHTLGLVGRIYISGRPPVTNLASSAIFIAWGMVIFSFALERIYRNGIGSVTAAVAGFCSLLIADKLALQGDTLNVLQAVLDTNFWLATHVVVITLGYAATFLAGTIAIIYIILGVFTTFLTADLAKTLTRMTYGIVCFAILFSFVGTILGGIWADQSWGRFWGWDPKENGAVLIVLANALLLHARWGGLVQQRGIAALAVFGNIVTSWSWFGTNMLGVGLHSYGFMDKALMWLLVFILSQVFLIAAAMIPQRYWISQMNRSREAAPTPPHQATRVPRSAAGKMPTTTAT